MATSSHRTTEKGVDSRWGLTLRCLRFLETPAIQDVPVIVERPPGFWVVKGIIRTHLRCCGETTHEASLMAVDQRVGAAVPSTSIALNKAEQVDEEYKQ